MTVLSALSHKKALDAYTYIFSLYFCCSIFNVRLAHRLSPTALLSYHIFFHLSRGFLNFFEFFSFCSHFPLTVGSKRARSASPRFRFHALGCPADSLTILPPFSSFVNPFFPLFSSSALRYSPSPFLPLPLDIFTTPVGDSKARA